ncbi:tyrosine-type recombinase/integrase [Rouxiella sp. S1S-2]|uniref:tyrosine-type recombinase/integrase n=1 Tax=Rouxiella sp. S1S-2 TaxID=2653856 RepID=UPI00126472CA|nr:site-specific integrase [Rouxiella sp. S1S-2]KAB7896456.1 tyrosine-type recombinase/integrase [Rouxiella sp. S1S-2]
MASFSVEKRTLKDGAIKYRCTLSVKEGGEFIHRERKTFAKISLAKAWGRARVAHIEQYGIPNKHSKSDDNQSSSELTLGELISKYMKHEHVTFGRSKRDALNLIKKHEISDLPLSKLTQQSFITHCDYRRQKVSPSTAAHDINYIGAVLNSAKPLFGINANITEFIAARNVMFRMNMIGTGNTRNRRPTSEEIDLLMISLRSRQSTSYHGIPYADIFMFSILSCMRIGEVTRLLWSDVDKASKAVLVRDRKDPKKKIGNHMIVPLLGEAWEILNRQPEEHEYIFPYKSRTITQTYRQERDELGILDLRYHDLRREGASRLFEAGFSLEEVAQVTGHKSLSTLWNVYREIFPQSLHDKFAALQDNKKAYVAK